MNSLTRHMIMADQIWSLNFLPLPEPCSLIYNFIVLPLELWPSGTSLALNFGLSEETCFGQRDVDGSDGMTVLSTHLKKSCAVAISMKRAFLCP